MVTRSTTGAECSESNARGAIVRSVGGLVLALAVVAGIGARHMAQQRGGAINRLVTQDGSTPVVSTAQEGRGAVRGDQGDQHFAVYLVSADEQAAQLQDTIAEGNRILAGLGRPAFNAAVVVVNSAEQEAEVVRANADVDAIRAGLGLPGLTMIDLRGR